MFVDPLVKKVVYEKDREAYEKLDKIIENHKPVIGLGELIEAVEYDENGFAINLVFKAIDNGYALPSNEIINGIKCGFDGAFFILDEMIKKGYDIPTDDLMPFIETHNLIGNEYAKKCAYTILRKSYFETKRMISEADITFKKTEMIFKEKEIKIQEKEIELKEERNRFMEARNEFMKARNEFMETKNNFNKNRIFQYKSHMKKKLEFELKETLSSIKSSPLAYKLDEILNEYIEKLLALQ